MVNGVLTKHELTNSIGMEFVLISAGVFTMGSPDWDTTAFDREQPAHQVTISQPFYLGKYPVTQAQWQAVMGRNPSRFKAGWKTILGWDRTTHPVERVSWNEAREFLAKLNEWEDVSEYQLPTEAQWEYACRAGSTSLYYFGNDASVLGDYACYAKNSRGRTQPVGQRQPNDWGLYDMHGNVWEWVQDHYGPYRTEAVTDAHGPEAGGYRVLRGGSWLDNARHVRSADRLHLRPDAYYEDTGLRLVRVLES